MSWQSLRDCSWAAPAYWRDITDSTGQKLGIDWLKTIAGALAAVSAALLLSTLGAAGTIIGAAVGSVVATVGGALYSQGLARCHERLAQASNAARRKVGIAQAEVRRANRLPKADQSVDAALSRVEEQLAGAKGELDAAEEGPDLMSWRERLRTLPWNRILLVAAGLFVATLLAITVFELVAGRTISSITGGTDGSGGTSITRIGGGAKDSSQQSPTKPTSPTSPTVAGTVGPLPQPSSSTTAVPSATTAPTRSPTSPAATASSTPPTATSTATQ